VFFEREGHRSQLGELWLHAAWAIQGKGLSPTACAVQLRWLTSSR
jgi:hypothetical protein